MEPETLSRAAHGRPRRARFAALAILLAVAILAVAAVVLMRPTSAPEKLARRALVRQGALVFLQGLRVAYAVALPGALVAAACAAVRLRRSRRLRRADPFAGRLLLLGLSTICGLALMEASAASWQAWSHRFPSLPLEFPDDAHAGSARQAHNDVLIVVIGESSARGTPYHPWLSVAQIAAWQLERVFPGRRFHLLIRAVGGTDLEQAVLALRRLDRRPDAIMVLAGHNEFQARYGWSRTVRYYEDEGGRRRGLFADLTARVSPLCRLIEETIDTHLIDQAPPRDAARALIDRPSFTAEEYQYLRDDFERRLEGIVAYCKRIGALPILVAPPSNEGDFPPDRSYLEPEATARDRDAAARLFEQARRAEAREPARAERLYQELLAQHEHFAEAHYRLAGLLERAGRRAEARIHYLKARDDDGLPMRCPSDFLAAYARVARRHDAVFVDGPEVLRGLSPGGIVDSHLMHDAQHPTFRGYLALAQALLQELHDHRAFGWPDGSGVPRIDPAECAEHFGMDGPRWSLVCDRTAAFYARTAQLRYDSLGHHARAQRLLAASREIEAGKRPEEVGIAGLGVYPAGLPR